MKKKNFYFFQSFIAFFLVLFALAAGHLFMVVVEHIDKNISFEFYKNSRKIEGRWFGDSSIVEELNANLRKVLEKNNKEEEQIYKSALGEIETKGNLKFYLLPPSNFLIYVMFSLFGIGLLILVFSKFAKNDAIQTLTGLIAGLFLWTGVEFSLVVSSRILGIAKNLEIFEGIIIGKYGEYVLMKYSWGFLIVVVFYILFLECSRCNFFLFFRRNFNLMRGTITTGKINNYAPHTAFMFSAVTWFFYVLLLLAYDRDIFGVYSWFTYLVFFLSFSFTGYLFLKLIQIKGFGPRLRYAIPTTMVFWNDIEILAKWRIFEEPWLILNPITAMVFFGGLFLGIYLVLREIRKIYQR